VPVPVITAALYRALRVAPGRVVRGEDHAALRNEFGGHAVKSE
jgi:6-phosphogluconate dehydrogenase (decarboxylating)